MSNTDHVVFKDNAFRCLHCGASEPVEFPIDVMVFVKASKRFLKPHRDCKPLATVLVAAAESELKAGAH